MDETPGPDDRDATSTGDATAPDDPNAAGESNAPTGANAGSDSNATSDAGASGDAGADARAGDSRSGNDSLVAALVTFLFLPGLGHFVGEGRHDRGVAILLFYLVWIMVGWVLVVGGSFLLISVIAVVTLGFGAIFYLLWGLLLVVVLAVEFGIRILTAVDAYHHSEYVDKMTNTVDQYR